MSSSGLSDEGENFAHFDRIGEAEVRASIEGLTWGEGRRMWARKWLAILDHKRSSADRAEQMEIARKAASDASRAADAAERAATAAEAQTEAVALQAREARHAKWIAIVAAMAAIASAAAAIHMALT